MINTEEEIAKIHARNARVEKDKAWETSVFRKLIIGILTYFVVVSFFLIADLPKPYLNAMIPSMAFILSTLSLPFFRKIWEKFR